MDKILKKKYCRIEFQPSSPLMLGSGESELTDKDLVKDSHGRPYIPASSIAGVIREKLKETEEKGYSISFYLGDVRIKGKDGKNAVNENSRVIFYDAIIPHDIQKGEIEKHITVRDSVALDEYKTAKKGAKFDMEVLEPGEKIKFVTYLEQDFDEAYNEDFLEKIAKIFNGEICFGAKTMRGYGEIKLNKIEKAEFALNESTGLSAWLDFDMFDYDKWEPFTEATAGNTTGLTVKLHQKSGISIRHYTTKVSTEAKTEPDFEQMTLNDATPVIPGTSWAGAFRHRMEEFGIQRGKGSIFGYVEGDGDDEKAVSCIRFGESTIKDAKEKVLSRNAIDRFSGGTKDGALFTERTYYGGTTELKISWRARKGKTMDDKEKEALAAALTDLHFGLWL